MNQESYEFKIILKPKCPIKQIIINQPELTLKQLILAMLKPVQFMPLVQINQVDAAGKAALVVQ